jgi:hypothetical protein
MMSGRPSETESELVEFLRSIDVRAPEELHRRIQALVVERSTQHRRPSPRARLSGGWPSLGLRLGGGVALAAGTAVVLLLLSSSGAGSPPLTMREASALTLRGATMAAPGESSANHNQLATAVDGVAFPYWGERFGWRSSGQRVDRVGGRAVTTVFYTSAGGRRIGYAIVAGTPPPRVSGGTIAWRGGTAYKLMRENGAQVVTWVRDGHMCVVSGRGVDSAMLVKLASWDERGVSS